MYFRTVSEDAHVVIKWATFKGFGGHSSPDSNQGLSGTNLVKNKSYEEILVIWKALSLKAFKGVPLDVRKQFSLVLL